MIVTIKRFSWATAVLLLAFAFPMQVVFDNPNMALLAYIPVLLICVLFFLKILMTKHEKLAISHPNGVDIVVALYMTLILSHVVLAAIIGQVSTSEACRQIFLFIFPVFFYFCTSRFADEGELIAALKAILISALVVGVYFAYDSYMKLGLKHINEYQVRAFKYAAKRAGENLIDAPPNRIGPQYRSMGLLESHTVSGAWIGFGAFSSLFFLAGRSKTIRLTVGLGWFIMLIMGFNFTSIIGFLITIFVVHVWRGANLDSFSIIRTDLLRRFTSLLATTLIIGVSAYFCFTDFASKLLGFAQYQFSLLFSSRVDLTYLDASWITILISDTIYFFSRVIRENPLSLFWGNGTASLGVWRTGGDTGFLDTLAIFGLPMFCVIFFSLYKMGRNGFRQLKLTATQQTTLLQRQFLEFGLSVIFFIFIFEAHYSVWIYKSVSPILFIALGLIRRYGDLRQESLRP